MPARHKSEKWKSLEAQIDGMARALSRSIVDLLNGQVPRLVREAIARDAARRKKAPRRASPRRRKKAGRRRARG